MVFFNHIKYFFLGVSINNATFKKRGFYSKNKLVEKHLEEIGFKFLHGYHLSLKLKNDDLIFKLNSEKQYKGFCFEGAAMALTILDTINFLNQNNLSRLMNHSEGLKHVYMLHVGAGWAYARLPVNLEKKIRDFDPVLRWLIIDGYGFHQAYFKTKKYVYDKKKPKELRNPFSKHVFYQGIGRCLWFVDGADAERIAERISTFPIEYQSDLWAGIGLACTYAGGVDEHTIRKIRKLSGDYLPHLFQGAVFAAKARERSDIITPNNELACRIICQLSVCDAASIADKYLLELPEGLSSEEQYDWWRKSIRLYFTNTIKDETIFKEIPA